MEVSGFARTWDAFVRENVCSVSEVWVSREVVEGAMAGEEEVRLEHMVGGWLGG